MNSFKSYAAMLLCLPLLLSSCGASNTLKGTGIGVGAGAAVGGSAGALIGKKMDKQKKELEAALPDATIETVNNGESLKLTFDSGILFATNSNTVSDASKNALRHFSSSLRTNPDTYIKIIGHTDNTGRIDYNQTLSEKRAQSVYDYLLDQGVSSSRITYEGRGIHEPVATNNTPQGRALNRRVEILIMANEKMIREAQQGTLR
jgi:outer membrane protein OmpA-like peptidoglycan-associated protein